MKRPSASMRINPLINYNAKLGLAADPLEITLDICFVKFLRHSLLVKTS